MIPISSTVYKVRIFKLWPATKKCLCNLFSHGSDRSPRQTLDVVHSWWRRYVAVAVTVQLTATKWILMPDLEVNFRPSWTLYSTRHKTIAAWWFNTVVMLLGSSTKLLYIARWELRWYFTNPSRQTQPGRRPSIGRHNDYWWWIQLLLGKTRWVLLTAKPVNRITVKLQA